MGVKTGSPYVAWSTMRCQPVPSDSGMFGGSRARAWVTPRNTVSPAFVAIVRAARTSTCGEPRRGSAAPPQRRQGGRGRGRSSWRRRPVRPLRRRRAPRAIAGERADQGPRRLAEREVSTSTASIDAIASSTRASWLSASERTTIASASAAPIAWCRAITWSDSTSACSASPRCIATAAAPAARVRARRTSGRG